MTAPGGPGQSARGTVSVKAPPRTNRQGVEISEGPGCHDEECIYKIVFVVAGGLALMT